MIDELAVAKWAETGTSKRALRHDMLLDPGARQIQDGDMVVIDFGGRVRPVACGDAQRDERVTDRDPRRGIHRGLAEEWVVVTGAAGLIGRAVVDGILAAGGRVVAVDRLADSLTELGRYHGSDVYRSVSTDITYKDPATGLLSRFASLRPRLMVHAAGWQVPDGGMRMPSADEWAAVFGVHVTAPVLWTWALLESVHERGDTASAVFLSSVHENVVFGDISYGAAKGALAKAVRDLAAQAADHGSRINAVAPGHVAAEGVPSPPTPLGGRPVSPEAVASSVLFLLCDHCSPQTTGTSLLVDGGLSLQDPWARQPGRPRRRWWS